METGSLILTEYIMVGVFVVGLVWWGYSKRAGGKTMNKAFLADRKVPGWIASLSTVATTLNVNDFIGMAGSVYAVGIIMAHFPLIAGVCLLILSLVLVHKLRAMKVITHGEWLGKRYSPAIGHTYSIVWSCVWMVVNLGLYIYGGALILNTLMGWNFVASVFVLSAIGAFYTISGGFGVVVGTNVLQVMLMFFPFVVLAPLAIMKAGGISNIVQSLPASHVNMWYPDTPFGPISLMVFGVFITTTSFWSSEAQILQRPLSARSSEDASITYLGASFWYVILLPFLVLIPALAAKVLFPDLAKPDLAAPMLIKTLLPRGLYGMAVVGLMAGFLSSAASQINSFCAMFTSDVYKRLLRPGKEESHYMFISKVAGIAFTFVAIGMTFVIARSPSGMFIYVLGILATIMPPFAAITILGVIWPKSSAKGAALGLIVGGGLALLLFFTSTYTEFFSKISILEPLAQLGNRVNSIADDTFSFRASVCFIVTGVFTLIGSLIMPGKVGEDETVAASASVKHTKQVWVLAGALAFVVVVMYVTLTIIF